MEPATRPPGDRAEAGDRGRSEERSEEGDALSRRKRSVDHGHGAAGRLGVQHAWGRRSAGSLHRQRRRSRSSRPPTSQRNSRSPIDASSRCARLCSARLHRNGRRRRPTGSTSSYSKGGPLQVTTRTVEEGTVVLVDGKAVFRVLPGDVDQEAGETVGDIAAEAARNLQQALNEIREGQDARTLLPAAGYALLATLLLAGLFWLLLRGYHWSARRAHAVVQRRFPKQLPAWAGQVVGEAAVAGLFTVPLKLARAAARRAVHLRVGRIRAGAVSLHASLGRGAARQPAADAGSASAKPSSRRFRDCCSSR